jgi:hypothetical protein
MVCPTYVRRPPTAIQHGGSPAANASRGWFPDARPQSTNSIRRIPLLRQSVPTGTMSPAAVAAASGAALVTQALVMPESNRSTGAIGVAALAPVAVTSSRSAGRTDRSPCAQGIPEPAICITPTPLGPARQLYNDHAFADFRCFSCSAPVAKCERRRGRMRSAPQFPKACRINVIAEFSSAYVMPWESRNSRFRTIRRCPRTISKPMLPIG